MKKKYIVGDIVMYKNRIHTIIDILNSNGYELSYVRHPVSPVRLSGVSLTPGILEKNGWKKGNYGYWTNEDICISEDRNGEFSIDICNNDYELPFVHSLQHLLFGLGIKSEMEV